MCITTKYLSNNIVTITKDIRSNYTYVEDPPWCLSHNQFFTNCHSSESWNPVSFKGFYFYDSLIFIVLRQSPWRNKFNRLKKVERYNTKYFDLTGEYSYDPDGNFTSLTRSYNSDNFSYQYYSGTNRLKKVSGSSDQFTYDYNGNQTNDYLNNNTSIKYDHRNLITEFTRQDLTQDPPVTDITRYKYDEAGNRIRKTIYRSNDSNPPPLPEENEDLPSGWSITKDEYYSRDASGKEIAVYQSYNLDYWNVWGTGNEGRIKSTGMKYFYLKDHLGSIRAVINQNNVIVQAQDYDPWGHIARTWDSTSADYKFTGKERDQESSYDYFGARYYDSRIGRWGQMEPLMEKHIQWTPYNYVLCNTLKLVDPNGKQVIVIYSGYGLQKQSSIIDPKDYSAESAIGAVRLMYFIKNYLNSRDKLNSSYLKGYYSSFAGIENNDAIVYIKESLSKTTDKRVFLYGYSTG
ncbi:MAG: RHS repeat-associated core domain-containing protein [Ignavibacteriae bacterium]|nr:RHS repeat-associated core domain-containing protein [Ignavibacteriota bacterium]